MLWTIRSCGLCSHPLQFLLRDMDTTVILSTPPNYSRDCCEYREAHEEAHERAHEEAHKDHSAQKGKRTTKPTKQKERRGTRWVDIHRKTNKRGRALKGLIHVRAHVYPYSPIWALTCITPFDVPLLFLFRGMQGAIGRIDGGLPMLAGCWLAGCLYIFFSKFPLYSS